jgi:Protein of unknown function (DUF1236)
MATLSSWAVLFTLATAAPVWALAPTSDVAKACRQRAVEAHPTQLAGSKHGSAEFQIAYFRNCLSKMDEGPLLLSDAQKSTVLRILGTPRTSALGLGTVSVGAEVPHSIEVKNFPSDLTKRVPELAPYRYFPMQDRIAVVRPSSSQVIMLIDAH